MEFLQLKCELHDTFLVASVKSVTALGVERSCCWLMKRELLAGEWCLLTDCGHIHLCIIHLEGFQVCYNDALKPVKLQISNPGHPIAQRVRLIPHTPLSQHSSRVNTAAPHGQTSITHDLTLCSLRLLPCVCYIRRFFLWTVLPFSCSELRVTTVTPLTC